MMAALKIAMVSEHASPLASVGDVDAGGQNVHVAALCAALARQGHEVTVFTRRDSEDLPERVTTSDGYVVEHITAGPADHVPKDELLPLMRDFAARLTTRVHEEKYDVVHAHFWMSGLAALVATRDTGIPVVQTFHALGTVKQRHQGADDTSPPGRLRVERAVARDVRRIVATCNDEVAELVRMGAPRSSISVIPCGVDISHFTPDGPAAPLPTDGSGRHRLLVVGRLVQRKGVDDAIRALSQVRDAELVIAGGPPMERLDEDEEVARLRHVALRAGVLDRVTFLGQVTREDMPSVLRACDVLVTVPWYEPFGITALEAMACGLPVVASAVGGLQDTVIDAATGSLVQPRRPDQLALTLRRLLADPMRRQGYGYAGLDRATARYSWDRVATDTEAVYRAVTDRILDLRPYDSQLAR